MYIHVQCTLVYTMYMYACNVAHSTLRCVHCTLDTMYVNAFTCTCIIEDIHVYIYSSESGGTCIHQWYNHCGITRGAQGAQAPPYPGSFIT